MNTLPHLPLIKDKTGQIPLREVNCTKITASISMNCLSTASITLSPGEIPPDMGDLVEIFSLSGSLGLFTADKITQSCTQGACFTTVTLTSALSILGRRVLIGYREMGGPGMDTGSCISALLNGTDFILGTCDFSHCFSYAFENENLLTALFSLLSPLTEEHMLTADYSSYPWTLSLLRLGQNPLCEISTDRNASEVTFSTDTGSLVTKVYPLGYGEGADRLNISSVNGGETSLTATSPFEESVERETVLSLPNVTDPATLKSMAQAALSAACTPAVTVTASAEDFHYLTHSAYDLPSPGKMCRIKTDTRTALLRIQQVHYGDLVKCPQLVTVTMGAEPDSPDKLLSELTRRTKLTQLYSQGAPCEYAVNFADNCDPTHPAVLRFFIDDDAIHVNAVKVHFAAAPFRAYSKATTASPASSATSSAGGSTTLDASALHIPVQTDSSGVSFVAMPGHHHVLGSHTHSVSFAAHSHGISYGIYEAPASSGTISVTVDGNPVPADVTSSGSFDAAVYLAKNSQGKIRRGAWHQVEFAPSQMMRIEADAQVRCFIRTMAGAGM